MTVFELHRDLVTRILSVEDQAVLERLRLRLIEDLEAEGFADEADDFAEMPRGHVERLENISARMSEGIGVVSEDEFNNRLQRWES